MQQQLETLRRKLDSIRGMTTFGALVGFLGVFASIFIFHSWPGVFLCALGAIACVPARRKLSRSLEEEKEQLLKQMESSRLSSVYIE